MIEKSTKQTIFLISYLSSFKTSSHRFTIKIIKTIKFIFNFGPLWFPSGTLFQKIVTKLTEQKKLPLTDNRRNTTIKHTAPKPQYQNYPITINNTFRQPNVNLTAATAHRQKPVPARRFGTAKSRSRSNSN